MTKEWEIVGQYAGNLIYAVKRLSDGVVLRIGQPTLHGPIKQFIEANEFLYGAFEWEDASCNLSISEIKLPPPIQDPCDESHTDVWARTQAIKFAEWISVEGWQEYDGIGRWICPSQGNNVLISEQLYKKFIKETENK